MTVAERTARILEKIEKLKAEGADMRDALAVFGVFENEQLEGQS